MARSLSVPSMVGMRSRSAPVRNGKGLRHRKPSLERLEDRMLLSGGQLDPSFGNGGISGIPASTGMSTINDVQIEGDGKAVVAGNAFTLVGGGDFGVARFNLNGTLDTTFGGSGVVTTDFGGNEQATAVAVQPLDSKIIVAGSTSVGSNIALARYNVNGSLDNSFGKSGQVTTDLGGTDTAQSITLQPDGSILVSGSSNSSFALVRYTAAGVLDPNFGNGGKVITPVSGADSGNDVLVQSDGKILVGGTDGTHLVVLRYLATGALDVTFGNNGSVVSPFPGQTTAFIHDMIIQPDSKIVAVGESFGPLGKEFALARYNPNGSLDASFGTNGEVLSTFSVNDVGAGVVIQDINNKIVVAGSSAPGTMRLARYNIDGTIDTTFGTNGSVNVPAGSATSIALQTDGKVVVAGQVVVNTVTQAGVARFFLGNPQGDFDFSQSTFVGKDGGTALITVNRDSGQLGAVSVHYSTSDGSASAGVQYVATSGTLSFAAGEKVKTFIVPLLADGIIDGTTTVNLTLSNPTGGATLGDRPTAVLNITDAPGSLQFSSPSYSVTESAGKALITVTRAVGDGGPVTVNFATSDGSAVGGIDYVPSNGTLLFADGQLSASFTVPLINNPLASGTLTVNLALSAPTGGATLGLPANAVLDIQVAPGQFVFSNATFSAKEDGGLALVTVNRVNGSDGATSVQFATSDGTAVAGVNYVGTSGTLQFGPGQTSSTFTVPILEDNHIDGNLGINLTLSNPTGGATLGGRQNAVLIIIDAPGKLQFSSPSYSIQESAGLVNVSVVRTVGVGGAVSVDFALANGTAKAGTDYVGTPGTITFAPGELSKSITIPILDDGVTGGVNKTFTLSLSNPQGGATLGTATTATVTILDDHQVGTQGDWTGAGKANLAVFRPTTGQFLVQGVGVFSVGQPGDIPVPGAYDGGGRTEAAVYRPSTATWYIMGPTGVIRSMQFGEAGVDRPVPADYDGDGKTDIAVYRPTTGQWFILNSSIGPQVVQWGNPNLDEPVPGNYDGAGRANLAVYEPSTGIWTIRTSAGGPIVRQFGAPNLDIPIPADYDGDHKTDLALFRPTTDTWIIQLSSGGTVVKQYGLPGIDEPVPADYDGDGKADFAVYRPTTGQWLITFSGGGNLVTPFGVPGLDIPAQPPVALQMTGVGSNAPSFSPKLTLLSVAAERVQLHDSALAAIDISEVGQVKKTRTLARIL